MAVPGASRVSWLIPGVWLSTVEEEFSLLMQVIIESRCGGYELYLQLISFAAMVAGGVCAYRAGGVAWLEEPCVA